MQMSLRSKIHMQDDSYYNVHEESIEVPTLILTKKSKKKLTKRKKPNRLASFHLERAATTLREEQSLLDQAALQLSSLERDVKKQESMTPQEREFIIEQRVKVRLMQEELERKKRELEMLELEFEREQK